MSEIDAKFKQMQKRFETVATKPQIERALHRIGSLLEYKIKENIVRIGLVDTGYLLNSIRYSVKMSQYGGEVLVGSYGVKYAAIHEFGGIIRPKSTNKSGYLTFYSKKFGGFRRVRQVNIREKRYMRTAVDNTMPRIMRILGELGGKE